MKNLQLTDRAKFLEVDPIRGTTVNQYVSYISRACVDGVTSKNKPLRQVYELNEHEYKIAKEVADFITELYIETYNKKAWQYNADGQFVPF